MNLSNSNFYNSLPRYLRDDIISSGVHFHNDEELNAYVANTSSLFPNNLFFSYPYSMGFGAVWPMWPF